jgi:hypothetical protein
MQSLDLGLYSLDFGNYANSEIAAAVDKFPASRRPTVPPRLVVSSLNYSVCERSVFVAETLENVHAFIGRLTQAVNTYDDAWPVLHYVHCHSAHALLCLIAPLAPSSAEECWMVLYCGSGGDDEDLDPKGKLEQEETEELAEDEELQHLPRKGHPETFGSIFGQRFPVAEPKEKIDLMKSPSLLSEVRDTWEAKNQGNGKAPGWGFAPLSRPAEEEQHSTPLKSRRTQFNFPPEARDAVMFGPSEMRLCDPRMYQLNKELGTDMAFSEVDHGCRLWFDIGKKSAEQAKVPILDAPEKMVHCGCLPGKSRTYVRRPFLRRLHRGKDVQRTL